MKLKIAVCVVFAVLLQTNLRLVWPPLVHLDLPLVVVTYFALRRDVVQALIVGFVAGLATDFFSKGLLGANGFSKTLIAYLIVALVTRVMLDNPLARIPVLAGAVALDALIIVLLLPRLANPEVPGGSSPSRHNNPVLDTRHNPATLSAKVSAWARPGNPIC